MAGNEQSAQEVGKNPNGVGYVGLAYVKASGIKWSQSDGAMPSKESVLGKAYPYAAAHVFYTNGEPTGWPNNCRFHDQRCWPKNVEQVWICPDQIANTA